MCGQIAAGAARALPNPCPYPSFAADAAAGAAHNLEPMKSDLAAGEGLGCAGVDRVLAYEGHAAHSGQSLS